MSILYKSAFELAREIKSGKLKSREVLEFFIDRIAKYNGMLNAVVAFDYARARELADEADQAVSDGKDWGALHGVPVTIKDALCTEGLVSTGAYPDLKDYVPKENAAAVQRYVDAGAIIFGKTNLPFASGDWQTYNDIYGQTNNPWDVARTCGGSSGGAAASLAAGLTPLELGSDIAGSIRIPSHFNGVYGHKPTYGIISSQGHMPPAPGSISENDLSVVGPLTTCADDLEQALRILICSAPEEMGRQVVLPEARVKEVAELRVATYFDDPFCSVDKQVIEVLENVAVSLEQAGATITRDVKPDFDFAENHRNYFTLLNSTTASDVPIEVVELLGNIAEQADADDNSPAVVAARGLTLSHAQWLIENEKRLQMRAKWQSFFEDYDVLLCPPTIVPAFPHENEIGLVERTLKVNGQQREYLDLACWSGFSLNSYLPATVVPAGRTTDNLPVGVQIVAPYMEDYTSIEVAKMLEICHRKFEAPPGYAEE